jgi:hypothetical protein
MQPRNGRWYVRWREGGRRRGRTFDRKSDAKDFLAWLRRRQKLGHAAVPDDVKLAEFVETYWRLHAVPNLSPATRELYGGIWERHILPVLGEYGASSARNDSRAFAPSSSRAASAPRPWSRRSRSCSRSSASPSARRSSSSTPPPPCASRATRGRASPTSSCPTRSSASARNSRSVTARSCRCWRTPARGPRRSSAGWRGGTSVSNRSATSTASAGASASALCSPTRPRSARMVPGVRVPRGQPAGVARPQRPVLGPRRLAQLAQADLAGRARAPALRPVAPDTSAHRLRARRHSPSRPALELRDLTRVQGIPLTQIAREVGTSARMIEEHYAGVIANWDAKRVPAERQIRAARRANGLTVDSNPKTNGVRD